MSTAGVIIAVRISCEASMVSSYQLSMLGHSAADPLAIVKVAPHVERMSYPAATELGQSRQCGSLVGTNEGRVITGVNLSPRDAQMLGVIGGLARSVKLFKNLGGGVVAAEFDVELSNDGRSFVGAEVEQLAA
jgi:hypothetical protein